MTPLAVLAGVGVVLVAISRVIAVGRKQPKTVAEQRADFCQGIPVAYKRTQPANPWKLRMRRSPQRKRA